MSILSDFAVAERELYLDSDNNLFAFSLGQATRYYDFIQIIAGRHQEVSQKMVSNHTKLTESLSTQESGSMTEEQMRIFEDGMHLGIQVHLEIESFYLFAKIFLDMIARFILNYFGGARGIKLNSHDKLTKSYEEYRLAKNLIFPDRFAESLVFLKEHVCDYRDKQISHQQNPRTIKGTMFNLSGQTRIVATQLYPNASDVQVESSELPEIVKVIDQYARQVIDVIKLNRAKTRYALKENNAIH